MLGLVDYWMYRLNPNKKLKLGMSLLIKDEEDIIEANIRYHASVGVDCFVITDNNSKDSTREILDRLAKEYEILIITEKSTSYQQAKWTTRMAKLAKEKQAVDWLICNDADEFWVPEEGNNLKDTFCGGASIINCERSNMVVPGDGGQEDYNYLSTTLRVFNPVVFDKPSKVVLKHESLSLVLAKVGEKVAVNLHGLIKVKAGNHNAKHWWKKSRYKTKSVHIYHYPFRSYARFKNRVENFAESMANGGRANAGQHLHRWYEIYKEGRLEEEYKRLQASAEQLAVLENYGILKVDNKPSQAIAAAWKPE